MSSESNRPFLAFDTLTVVPFDRRLIVVELLSTQEREWINNYHARVWKCLETQVDAETRVWLEAAVQFSFLGLFPQENGPSCNRSHAK